MSKACKPRRERPVEFWKVDTKTSTVRRVQGDPHPGSDSDGDRVYENTHFLTEEAAWSQLRAEIEARVRLAADKVNEAQNDLRSAMEKASASNTTMALYIENRNNRDRLKKETR